MRDRESKELGAPAIAIGGLRIWVHGRQFSDSDDYWDVNWLRVTAHCGAPGAEVWVSGAIIHLSELAGWLRESELMGQTLVGNATLKCMEPELQVEMEMRNEGKMSMIVHITPNNLAQQHQFNFDLDQSYLPNVINGCRDILSRYPVKGTRN
jgi:hypothetical protein